MWRERPGRLALAIQRWVLRAGAGPLAPAWRPVYALGARLVALAMTFRAPATAYARGGLAQAELVPGLSDVDLAIVVPGDPPCPGAAARRLQRRWERISRIPGAALLIDVPRIYERADLDDLAGADALTYGLDAGSDRSGDHGPRESGYFGPQASADRIRALERPGLGSQTAGWVRLAGPARPLPDDRGGDPLTRAWLELAFCWRLAFRACADPAGARAADIAVKVVADANAIWLGLAHGIRPQGRIDALRRTGELVPGEEEVLVRFVELRRSLHRSPPAPVGNAVTALASASDRIRELIAGRAGARGTEEVTLAGPDASASPASGREPAPSADRGSVPLCDWRALVCPPNADEWLELRQGRPDDAAEIGRVCREPERGVHPALRGSALMVLPATGWHRTRMRAVQAEFSDPVSFALAEGRPAARFPRLRGWSAQDVAARAVAEHRARLRWGQAGALGERGLLLTAARSGLFHRSLAESDPVLCLTGAEAARRLGADPERIRDLRGAVASLPAFHDLDLGG